MLGEDTQTLSFRGRRSRNKVSVGEPAEGSLTFKINVCFRTYRGVLGRGRDSVKHLTKVWCGISSFQFLRNLVVEWEINLKVDSF